MNPEILETKLDDYKKLVESLKSDGFEMMVDLTVVDWFRKKHQYELVVEICILDNQEHILTRKPIEDTFDEYKTFLEYPEEKHLHEKDLGLAFDMDFPREDKS